MLVKITESVAKQHNLDSKILVVVLVSCDPITRESLGYSVVEPDIYNMLPMHLEREECEEVDSSIPDDWVEAIDYDPYAKRKFLRRSFPEFANNVEEFFEKLSDGRAPEDKEAIEICLKYLRKYNELYGELVRKLKKES